MCSFADGVDDFWPLRRPSASLHVSFSGDEVLVPARDATGVAAAVIDAESEKFCRGIFGIMRTKRLDTETQHFLRRKSAPTSTNSESLWHDFSKCTVNARILLVNPQVPKIVPRTCLR